MNNFLYGFQWGLGFFVSLIFLVLLGLCFVKSKKFIDWFREKNKEEEEDYWGLM